MYLKTHDKKSTMTGPMPCPAKGGGQPGTPCAAGPERFIKEMNFWDVHGMVAEELPSWQRRWGDRRLLSS